MSMARAIFAIVWDMRFNKYQSAQSMPAVHSRKWRKIRGEGNYVLCFVDRSLAFFGRCDMRVADTSTAALIFSSPAD